MSSAMRNFMEAYNAVHNSEAKEEFYSQRDPISEMNTGNLSDNDLREIAEEVCETLFEQGVTVKEAIAFMTEILVKGENVGRNKKVDRLYAAFAETFNNITSKAKQLEEFAKHRQSKKLQETWSARHNQEKRVQRHHSAIIAEDRAAVKAGLLKMVEVEVEEGYDEPKMHSAVKRVMTTQPAAKGRAASRLHSKYSMRSKGNVAGETDGPGPNAPKRSGRKGRGAETDRGSGNAAKRRMSMKEAFAFSEVELEELALLEEIDAMTDEQLIDMMEDIIIETAEDIDDLIEICEHLEEVELLDEASDKYYDSAVKSSKAAAKANLPSRVERMKSAAKAAGSKLKAGVKAAGSAAKKGIKAAGKSAVSTAGKVAGTYQGEKEAARIKAKRASMQRTPAKKKSSDDDGTGGKLDALLAKTRGASSSSSSDSGSSSSSSGSSGSFSSGSTRRAVGGALRKVGSLVKRGIKKAVGKTARAVSGGSDKLAKRLGEDYEHIAHLYESGLFSMQEIENVIEERYKGKHGQSDKEYADSRSPGGKMVSGDSKQSGAEYTHGRRVKAANPGMQPDVGGKTKPKSQGKMDRGTRADLEYRKANLKKEEIEMEEGYKEIDRDKENKMYRRAGNLARTGLSSKGKKKEDALNKSNKIVSAISRQKENERFKKMGDEKARDNYKESWADAYKAVYGVDEEAKPDYLDFDKDGNKKESMKKALKDKKKGNPKHGMKGHKCDDDCDHDENGNGNGGDMGEQFKFSEAELAKFDEIVNSWDD